MNFNTNHNEITLNRILNKLDNNLLAPIYRTLQYDYVWGRQSMHQNLIADYKKRKNNVSLQVFLASVGAIIIVVLLLLLIFGNLYTALKINDFFGLFMVGFILLSILIIAAFLSVYLFYKNNHFEKRYYYLNSKYLIVLKEDAKRITVDKITQLDIFSAIKVEKNCIELYADTLTPIVIYCDNEAEIADFIKQQINQNTKNNE